MRRAWTATATSTCSSPTWTTRTGRTCSSTMVPASFPCRDRLWRIGVRGQAGWWGRGFCGVSRGCGGCVSVASAAAWLARRCAPGPADAGTPTPPVPPARPGPEARPRRSPSKPANAPNGGPPFMVQARERGASDSDLAEHGSPTICRPGRMPLPGQRYYPTTMTSTRRGPCTPSTRLSSMSEVAEGPEIRVSGCARRAASLRAARPSGKVATMSFARTMHRW